MNQKEALDKIKKVIDENWDSTEAQERRTKIKKYREYFSGEHWRKKEKQDPQASGIFVNLFFSTIMQIAPLLTDNKPIWSITARKPYFQKLAEMYKDAGDCVFDMIDVQDKTLEICIDALILGLGLWKVHYDPDVKFGGEVALDVIDPATFGMPDGYTDIWKTPWCYTRTNVPVSVIRERYPDRKIKADKESLWDKIKRLTSKDDGENKKRTVELTDVWFRNSSDFFDMMGTTKDEKGEFEDYKNGAILVYLDGMDEPLEYRPYPYNHGKPPYVSHYDIKVPHEFWGMGEIDNTEAMVLEYNIIMKAMARYLRTHCLNPDIWIEEGSGLDLDTYKEKAPGGGNAWTYPPGSHPPALNNPGAMSPAVLQMLNIIPNSHVEVSGVTETSKGMVSKKQRQSKFEVEQLAENSNTRTRLRIRNLESTYRKTYVLILELMQQYSTELRTYSKKIDEGNVWFNITNNVDVVKTQMQPKPLPDQPTDEEQQMYDQELQDYADLIAAIGDEESVYFPFQVNIDTNSTLPMDKQSLANLFLQLAQIQLTPQSAIDTESLLERLNIPNIKKILERLKAMAPQQPPQGMPQAGAPMPGQ